MNTAIQDVLNTIVYSSQNPSNISLTLKGVMLQFLPAVILIASAMGVHSLALTNGTDIINAITNIVAAALQVVSLVMILWGLIRKLTPAAPVTPTA